MNSDQERYRRLCDLLGGQAETARLVGLTENHLRKKCSGKAAILPRDWVSIKNALSLRAVEISEELEALKQR